MDREYSTSTDKEVYVKQVETKPEDSGAGWAVALIVLILAIGFGFIAFSNNQAANDLKTSQAIEELRRDSQSLTNNLPVRVPVAPATPPANNNVDINVPKVPDVKVELPKVEVPQADTNSDNPGVASGEQENVQ